MNILRGVITLILFVLFIAYAMWAWSSAPKKIFDAMSRLPLEEDDISNSEGPQP
ncbi:MAG TPA: cbb3-type cytochrome c oxidase subunit 3 [Steroidobacteraceae bacterium]|nr:cbb3-type cytochrome c oxidase subunit 3 [Steroidobacteraceae bacterium]